MPTEIIVTGYLYTTFSITVIIGPSDKAVAGLKLKTHPCGFWVGFTVCIEADLLYVNSEKVVCMLV